MLINAAVGGDAGGGLLRVFERDFGLGDGLVVVDAGFVEGLGEVEGLLVGCDGLVVEILKSILTAELEVVLGQIGLLGEALVFEVGGADLGGELVLAYGVADLAPEVGLPGDVKRERHDGGGGAAVGGDSGTGNGGGAGAAAVESAGGLRAAVRRISGDGWVVLRFCLADLRAGGHEVLKVLRDVLIVDVELIFQGVELGLVEGFPPLAFEGSVLRLRGLPCSVGCGGVGSGSGLFELGRRGRVGGDVLGADAATAEENAGDS